MADPVSWLLVEPGWRVVDASGADIGRVDEVLGDTETDIFDGLQVSSGMLSRRRYVLAESIDQIVEGTVRLKRDGTDAATVQH
jgi:Uncharacterized protein conserved in bacteria (DUF2171)